MFYWGFFVCISIEDIATPALGEAMAKVMFSYRVYCDDPKIRNVIVCHGELKEEQSYPCTDGAAYIQLYTLLPGSLHTVMFFPTDTSPVLLASVPVYSYRSSDAVTL